MLTAAETTTAACEPIHIELTHVEQKIRIELTETDLDNVVGGMVILGLRKSAGNSASGVWF